VNYEKYDRNHNPDKDNPGFNNTGGRDFQELFEIKKLHKQASKSSWSNKEDYIVPKNDRSMKWTNSEKVYIYSYIYKYVYMFIYIHIYNYTYINFIYIYAHKYIHI
jgi:hypothetical protein